MEFYRRGTAHLDDLTRGQLRDLRDDCGYYYLPELTPLVDEALKALDKRAEEAERTAQSLARVATYITDKGLLPLLAPDTHTATKHKHKKQPREKPSAPPAAAAAAAATTTTTTTTPLPMQVQPPQRKRWWEPVGVEDRAEEAVAGSSVMAVNDACVGEIYISPMCTYSRGDRTLLLDVSYAKGGASIGVVTMDHVRELRKMYVGDRCALRKQRPRLGMERDTWGISESGEYWCEATPYSTGQQPFRAGAHSSVKVRIDLDIGVLAFIRDNTTWSATIPRWAELCLAVVGSRGCTYTINH